MVYKSEKKASGFIDILYSKCYIVYKLLKCIQLKGDMKDDEIRIYRRW